MWCSDGTVCDVPGDTYTKWGSGMYLKTSSDSTDATKDKKHGLIWGGFAGIPQNKYDSSALAAGWKDGPFLYGAGGGQLGVNTQLGSTTGSAATMTWDSTGVNVNGQLFVNPPQNKDGKMPNGHLNIGNWQISENAAGDLVFNRFGQGNTIRINDGNIAANGWIQAEGNLWVGKDPSWKIEGGGDFWVTKYKTVNGKWGKQDKADTGQPLYVKLDGGNGDFYAGGSLNTQLDVNANRDVNSGLVDTSGRLTVGGWQAWGDNSFLKWKKKGDDRAYNLAFSHDNKNGRKNGILFNEKYGVGGWDSLKVLNSDGTEARDVR